MSFPKNFLWGAATSSHQVEGDTRNSWSEWEKANAERLAKEAGKKWANWQQEKFPEMFVPQNYISGRACDHYNRYKEDFDLAKEGGHNAHRFSIEWSRIEPEEGRFDEKEIEHYRQVILALRERGIEPFVTLWHWTHPLWLEKIGGCKSRKFAFYFERYAKYVADRLGKDVTFWITLNEPTTVIWNSYVIGAWPPQKMNPITTLKVYKILAVAHNKAYEALHKVNPKFKVGFANIIPFFEAYDKKSILDKLTTKLFHYFSSIKFLRMTRKRHDFLAVQYYFHNRIKFPGLIKKKNETVSDLGWEIYPEGIYHMLSELKKYNLPIYITENGIADSEDIKREKYIRDHLFWVHKAIEEGVNVCGYFYWSLLDNFEWDKGFWPRFGLIEIDYQTLERQPRKSFYAYKEIINNSVIASEAKQSNLK